jgi:Dolichyl-phosphate-mannose-protein mannosyltransferase
MNISENAHHDKKYKLKWLLIIFAIKSLLFVYFAMQFYEYARKGLVTSWIVVEQADTISYYNPAFMFVEDGEYAGMCRMPGLVPIYAIYAFPFGKEIALICVIVTQVLFSVLSTFLLAIIAARIIPHRLAFPLTALLYACSSFVSIWDHTLLSDSFATSFLIISFYFLIEFVSGKHWRYLLYAGFWLTWSIFIRQIGILFLPVFPLIWWVWRRDTFISVIKNGLIFIAPFVLFISLWTYRNYRKENVFVPMIKPIADCWTSYTPQFMKINELLIVWGEDVQYWISGSPSEWFNKPVAQQSVYPFRSSLYTSVCNSDTILNLQHKYLLFKTTQDTTIKTQLGDEILKQCDEIIATYKSEKPFGYFVVNRLKMAKDFIFPSRLDNTPGPAFSEMNILQKLVKLGYYFLLLLVNISGVVATIYILISKDWKMFTIALIPWSLIFVLACVMGYIEQRYLVPAYPFFMLLMVYLLMNVITRPKIKSVG